MRPADIARALAAPIRTSAGRAGLLHAGLTLLAALAILGTVYVVTAGYERSITEAAIVADVRALGAVQASGDLGELARQVRLRAAADPAGQSLFTLLDRGGAILAGNLPRFVPALGWQSFTIPGGDHEGDRGLGLGVALAEGSVLFVGRHQGQLEELEELIVRAILVAGAVAVLLSVAGGLLLGRSVQRRAIGMNRALLAVAEGDLTRRLPVRSNGDEFDALAGSVNATLERLQAAIARLHQVTGDIAHDLRTPLARLRQRLERASRAAPDGQVPREVVDRAVADVDQVLGIFAALLRIAQIESGERRASFMDVDLSAALSDVVDALAPTAEEAGRALSADIAPGVTIHGDRELLQQAFINLIENAFRHTPAASAVHVSLTQDAGDVRAAVADAGPGIAADDRDRVLRPFVRLDESRATEGTGLGLALVRAVADLHGAVLTLGDASPGLVVTMRLKRM